MYLRIKLVLARVLKFLSHHKNLADRKKIFAFGNLITLAGVPATVSYYNRWQEYNASLSNGTIEDAIIIPIMQNVVLIFVALPFVNLLIWILTLGYKGNQRLFHWQSSNYKTWLTALIVVPLFFTIQDMYYNFTDPVFAFEWVAIDLSSIYLLLNIRAGMICEPTVEKLNTP